MTGGSQSRSAPSSGGIRRARGFAVILMLVILVMGALYALTTSLNSATAGLQRKQEDANIAAMRQAKEGLIAWSATRVAGAGPGHLPCPDDDDDGVADTVACGNSATRIGRLPWKTLGLPDLRDSSGERLWYAVSRCFLERVTDTYCAGQTLKSYAVNSDTPGQLVVNGLSPATGVVAIIFAPGPPTARTAGGNQVRSGANRNDVTHYLEGENANNPAAACEVIGGTAHPVTGKLPCEDVFETRLRCETTGCAGGAFNDQLMLVRSGELFQVVENVVAKRVEDELAPVLRDYRQRYQAAAGTGIFPFAAPFDPGQPTDQFCGVSGTATGLLPVSAASTCAAWSAPTVTDTGGGSGVLGAWSCAATPASEPDTARMTAVTCTIPYTPCTGAPCTTPPTPVLRVNLTLSRAAMALGVPVEHAKLAFGNASTVYTGGTQWSSDTLGQSLTAGGDLVVIYQGQLPDLGASPQTVTITFPIYSAATRYKQVNPATPDTAWFFENEWYRVFYYAVAVSRLNPPVGATCVVGTDCLTVDTYPATFVSRSKLVPGPTDDKEVVLVLAGHLLPGLAAAGVSRPSTTPVIANYLELENLSSTDRRFEQRPRSPVFNDKVIVVSP